MTEAARPLPSVPPRGVHHHLGHASLWLLGVLIVLLVGLYIRLSIAPIPAPFLRDQAKAFVQATLPSTYALELGDTAVALEGPLWPVIQFSPVVLTDRGSGARVEMKALEIGFSPVRALIGQPGATITMVGAHIQIIQDLFGPRLSSFRIEDDPKGGPPVVKILAGEDNYPAVGISSKGIDVKGSGPGGSRVDLRSDNDWLEFNLKAIERGIENVITQTREGRFARLTIRDGTLDMSDNVYGLFRQYTDVSLDIAPRLDGGPTRGTFGATIGGRHLTGRIARTQADNGDVRLTASMDNVDFSNFLPFIDDPDGVVAIKGAGTLEADLKFVGPDRQLTGGTFHVDMSGTQMRIRNDFFPVETRPFDVVWTPQDARFGFTDVGVSVGKSSADISGMLVLGLDDLFGPTVAVSVTARDVKLQPNDLPAQAQSYSEIEYHGWSAPLYGALGIDKLVVSRPGVNLIAKGRVDMLRKGLGIDLSLSGAGASADDLKRLWPYFLAPGARDWFVKNVQTGKVDTASMRFSFPVGTLGVGGEEKPIPQNGMRIDLEGSDVRFVPMEGMKPVDVSGHTRVKVRDNNLTVSFDGATIKNPSGDVKVANAAFVIDNTAAKPLTFELSGDVTGDLPALVDMTGSGPGKLRLPSDIATSVPIKDLSGDVKVSVVSTITVGADSELSRMDYALNGTVRNFSSKTPIGDHAIKDGAMSFTASQAGYRVTGQANVDGIAADIVLESAPDADPSVLMSSTVDVKELKSMGFDAGQFLTGSVRFVARPMADDSLQIAIDLKNADLVIKDLGISKPAGIPGTLEAEIRQDGHRYEVSHIRLGFGDVDLAGSLVFDDEKGLESAEFSNFTLNPGDKAQLAITPLRDGYSVRLRGDQMDLKPMLKRFLGLGPDSGLARGQTPTDFALQLDIQLKQALGFYKTTAYNLDLNLTMRGSDMQHIEMQAQLGGEKSVSITTNELPNGRVTSVAFNDMGTMLRFAGIYPRLLGGKGSLVINTNSTNKTDTGEFDLHDFAVVDEANIAQILGNHKDSRNLIDRDNRVTFKHGRVHFVHTADKIDVKDLVLSGDSVGGTMHGAIYTKTRQYDLVGTYVPLFGVNSIFQKLPIVGRLIGGRDGEGLLGVTFAIRGDLDKPKFLVNPASMLVPGLFRSLFEFRAEDDKRKPATTQTPDVSGQ